MKIIFLVLIGGILFHIMNDVCKGKNRLINTYYHKKRLPFWEIWSGWFLGSVLSIICNTINIVTLCFWRPFWDLKFIFWTQKRVAIFELEQKAEQIMELQRKQGDKILKSEEQILADIDAKDDSKKDNKKNNNVFK